MFRSACRCAATTPYHVPEAGFDFPRDARNLVVDPDSRPKFLCDVPSTDTSGKRMLPDFSHEDTFLPVNLFVSFDMREHVVICGDYWEVETPGSVISWLSLAAKVFPNSVFAFELLELSSFRVPFVKYGRAVPCKSKCARNSFLINPRY